MFAEIRWRLKLARGKAIVYVNFQSTRTRGKQQFSSILKNLDGKNKDYIIKYINLLIINLLKIEN